MATVLSPCSIVASGEALAINFYNIFDRTENYLSFKSEYDFYKKRVLWLQSRVRFLQKIKELEMQIFGIDEERMLTWSAEKHEEKNKFMHTKIKGGLHSVSSNKGLVIVGLGHIINIWDKSTYNFGLLHLIEEDSDFCAEACHTYLIYSAHLATRPAILAGKKRIDICPDKLTQNLKEIQLPSTNIKEIFKQDMVYDMDNKLESVSPQYSDMNQYKIYCQPRNTEFYNEHTLRFIKDLGGNYIGKITEHERDFLLININASLFTKVRRTSLFLERLIIPQLTAEGFAYLNAKSGMVC